MRSSEHWPLPKQGRSQTLNRRRGTLRPTARGHADPIERRALSSAGPLDATNYNHRMTRRTILLTAALLTASLCAVAPAIAQNSAIFTDGAPDKANPPRCSPFSFPVTAPC